MTGFDYVALGIVGVSLIFGLWRGVVGEIIALVAWVLAIVAAVEFGAGVGSALFAGMSDPALRTLAGCVVIFVGVLVVMALFRMLVRSMVKALGLSVSDRILGMLFGLARGVLVCMVLVGLGGMTSAPQQAWWQQSTLAAPLETAVLATKPWLPDDLAKRIRFS
ncbi:CvpA family protein [Dechloromonas agitata]|uniref:CvpA family protein n=1 Tax=Dechloromonas agitata TaxID=73030 RepID=A0A930BRN8_9RHOO|nr:CvpA family protein [Dechloromonas agitata]MBF1164349.1 CvpA family protein [Dechloromonas agitata]MDE1547300.1 CvpA family protein [Dechloromonas agitata]